jgi:hypothetical protein
MNDPTTLSMTTDGLEYIFDFFSKGGLRASPLYSSHHLNDLWLGGCCKKVSVKQVTTTAEGSLILYLHSRRARQRRPRLAHRHRLRVLRAGARVAVS